MILYISNNGALDVAAAVIVANTVPQGISIINDVVIIGTIMVLMINIC